MYRLAFCKLFTSIYIKIFIVMLILLVSVFHPLVVLFSMSKKTDIFTHLNIFQQVFVLIFN